MSAELLIARCRLWLLKAYVTDLEEYQKGDLNRFGRMVGSGGVSLGSDSAWRVMVRALLVDELLTQYCATEIGECEKRVKTLEAK